MLATERVIDGVQVLKVVVAGTVAWWLAHDVMHSELVFLAPWTALMTVDATVYRSVRRGLQTLVAAALGVALSFVVVAPLGVTLPSVALALAIGMVLSRLPWIREEGVAVATTSLFVMAGHTQSDVAALTARLVDVLVGVVVGVVVNMAVAPPLRDQQADEGTGEIIRRLGRLLVAMADDLNSSWTTDNADAWIRRTVQLDGELDDAVDVVDLAQESDRWNVRRRRHPAPERGQRVAQLHEAVSHVRHLVRTVSDSTYADSEWDAEFRARWTTILAEIGERLGTGRMLSCREDLDRLAVDMSHADLPDLHWPVYGSLITGLRNLTLVADGSTGEMSKTLD